MHFSNGKIERLFLSFIENLPSITLVSIPFSIFVFNYVDNITKDAAAAAGNHPKLSTLLEALTSFKREVVVTAILIIGLLFTDYLIANIASAYSPQDAPFENFSWVATSVRTCVFTLSTLAITDQVLALLQAVDYRKMIPSSTSK
jgi:hypothetical protein